MALEINRRSLITGLAALVGAPAIVRAGNLMPVKQMLIVPRMIDMRLAQSSDWKVGDLVKVNGLDGGWWLREKLDYGRRFILEEFV